MTTTEQLAPAAETAAGDRAPRRRCDRPERYGALALVAATVAFNLVFLRQESSVVSTLNDSSVHEQMVRYATHQFGLGHLPLDGWFPYLGLGSPLFLHYQSFGASVTGLLGLVISPNRAFSLMLYLLLSLWPICVYASARLLGLGAWQAGAAALVTPLVTSVTGVGYEQSSYLWTGFGVWSQLVGMWMLPFAWALTTRAVRSGRGYAPAVVLITLTIASHFLTGYLTALPLVLVPLLSPSSFWRRLTRSLIIAAGAALCSLWVLVPLAEFGRYAAVNEFLQGSPDADSYGARQVLIWLGNGSIFDSGHLLPVLTVLCAVGLVVALSRWRADESSRLLLALFASSLVLFFGRPTLGRLVNLLPGSHDLFLRRFVIGVQLAGIYLIGVAICALVGALRGALVWRAPGALTSPARRLTFGALTVTIVLVALTPAWTAALRSDNRDAANIRLQIAADASAGGQVDALVAKARSLGPGRFFAGTPNDSWGSAFTVGSVPVFKYLANDDVDIVGYTLRTASLMTDPEAYFDEDNPADYPLFGVRYLILPTGRPPSVPARLVSRRGGYVLWRLPGDGYLRVVDTEGVIAADRANIGLRTAGFVRSSRALASPYPVIAYAGSAPPPTTLAMGATAEQGAAGSVVSSSPDLQEGEVSGTVRASRPAVVVLSASYDPGWQATVNDKPTPTQMFAPALVGVAVTAGRHAVTFRYVPPRYYPELFVIAIVTLLALVIGPRLARRRRAASPELETVRGD